jgi:type II secretory pathway pseudopilin PulG
MEMKVVLLILALGSISAFGQDDGGMMAAQAAQTGMAALQAMQQAQRTNLQFTQQMMDSNTSNSWPVVCNPRQPAFSVKSGKVKPGTMVRIRWRFTDNVAVVYYTTDGWTPTTASTRYHGPISIDTTTQLQAVAISFNRSLSPIAHAEYILTNPAIPAPPLALSADGVLHAGTRLQLITRATVNSSTAQATDKFNVLLDQDVKVGDAVVIPKGTPVDAVLACISHRRLVDLGESGRRKIAGKAVFSVA